MRGRHVFDDLFTLYSEVRIGALIRPPWRFSGVSYWNLNSTSYLIILQNIYLVLKKDITFSRNMSAYKFGPMLDTMNLSSGVRCIKLVLLIPFLLGVVNTPQQGV